MEQILSSNFTILPDSIPLHSNLNSNPETPRSVHIELENNNNGGPELRKFASAKEMEIILTQQRSFSLPKITYDPHISTEFKNDYSETISVAVGYEKLYRSMDVRVFLCISI